LKNIFPYERMKNFEFGEGFFSSEFLEFTLAPFLVETKILTWEKFKQEIFMDLFSLLVS